MSRYKKVFYIVGGGDESVGIYPSDIVVTIETNYAWTEDRIKETKEMLVEWDDNGAECYTQEEIEEMNRRFMENYGSEN